jgi:site-specific DNA-methyltransferase (adenine-specific)/modification methylase
MRSRNERREHEYGEGMKVEIGQATLYHADLLDVLPELPKAGAVVVDPPYGIGEAAGKNKSRGKLAVSKDYGNASWDDTPLDAPRLALVLAAAPKVVLWGGNYYGLPAASKWLVWDKMNGETDFADCELAWTNLPGAVRMFRHMWHGMLRDSERGPRVHPTQKPVALMRWCLQQIGAVSSVVDPCMGSAPVGVACMEAGVPYIGIEREAEHFETACERVENAQRQERLFA